VDEITGKTLLAWGYRPGSWFAATIAAAEEARRAGHGEAEIRAAVDRHLPAPAVSPRAAGALAHRLNIAPEDPDEIANVKAVEQHMTEFMRLPTVRAGAVMPDACPAGAAPAPFRSAAWSPPRMRFIQACTAPTFAARSRCRFFAALSRPRRSTPGCGSRISAAGGNPLRVREQHVP
jgi:hypothetical protein